KERKCSIGADAKDRSPRISATTSSSAVKEAIRGGQQLAFRSGAIRAMKLNQNVESAARSNFKEGAVAGIATVLGCPVEIAAFVLGQLGGGIGAILAARKSIQSGEGAARSDFEQSAIDIGCALRSGAIKCAIGQNQSRIRKGAVPAAVKGVKCGERS